MSTKQCITCNEVKEESEFGLNRPAIKDSTNFHASVTNQYSKECKKCKAVAAKKWRKNNPGYKGTGKITKYPEEDRLLVSAIRDRISTARQNTKRNPDKPFNLTTEYMYTLLKNQKNKCKLTNITLAIEKNTPVTLSIDKKEPNKGYIIGNVQWVCWAANRAKGDLSMNDFIGLCKAVLRTCNDYPEKE